MTPSGARARRVRSWLSRSLLAVPAVYLVAAIVLGVALPRIDERSGGLVGEGVGVATARDILSATATGMIAFTGLVIAGVLVVVQFAAGQYSPRLVLWFRRDRLVKHAIGSFLACWVYCLVALREIDLQDEALAPQITIGAALVLILAATLLFLALLQRVTDRLRPRALYHALLREGLEAVADVYPHRLGEAAPGPRAATGQREPARTVASTAQAGVITSFDRALLERTAASADVTIELVHSVGEYVAPGQGLLRIRGAGAVDDGLVRSAVDIAEERTIEQDPAFAMRIIVDTAIRALSPAVNDPTTAVHGIDVLEVMVRELAGRDLDASMTLDAAGRVRVSWPSPGWEDVLDLAFDEIRAYGASSVQICRRLRAALEDLRAATAPSRHAAIDVQVARLEASIAASHPAGSPDRILAQSADRTGIGLGRKAPETPHSQSTIQG